jgi:hypothetical protein
MHANGVWINLLASEGGTSGEHLAWGTVERPLILERSFKDGRLFRNLAALPRFWATWETETIGREAFLANDTLDFARKAYFTGPVPIDVRAVASATASSRRAGISIRERDDGGYEIETSSDAPFLLSSSEKLTPELRVSVDGASARALPINSIFAGVVVPPGRHTVVFERRIGRGWWPVSAAALAVTCLGAWIGRRKSASTRAASAPPR